MASIAEEFAAKKLGFASFETYAILGSNHKTFCIEVAKFKIIEHLLAVTRADKCYLESFSLHGANPYGVEALSFLRNNGLVKCNLNAKSKKFSLDIGVSLNSL